MSGLFLRASGIPLAMRCPGSARSPELAVSDDAEAARLGVAAHEAFRPLAEAGAIQWGTIPDIAARHAVSADEVRMLCAMATKLWPTLAPSFPDALTEVPLSVELTTGGVDVTFGGHVDVVSSVGTTVRAADWKTGRKDADYAGQMRAYAALLLLDDPSLTEASVSVVWVRDGEVETYGMRRAAVRPWLDELAARVIDWDGVYHPGNHCGFCPRSHECQAALAYVRRDVAAMSDRAIVTRAECELATMAPGEIIELHRKAELVRSYARRVDDAIRQHVLEHGDVVADGARLTVETTTRRELDPSKARPVLEGVGFAQTEIDACSSLSVSAVERLTAQRAGKGNGAAAVRELKAKLAEAGAITIHEGHQLKEKRA